MIKKIVLCMFVVSVVSSTKAQNIKKVSTVVPLLLINSDARSTGMGDVGVATTSDASSLFHNASKMAFSTSEYSVGINYSPWLQKLVDGLFIGGASITKKIDERSAWGANLRFFSLGKIELFDEDADPMGVENPSELTLAGSYALKLSDYYSMGVALRYIRSDLSIQVADTDMSTINGFGVDVSGFYQSPEKYYGNFNGRVRAGFNISNLGPKVSYTSSGDKNFIPTRLRLGTGFDFILDDYNTVAVTFETSKLLVPTPPTKEDGVIVAGKDDNVGWVEGIFQSFGDAPGGFSEELKEFTWGLGGEYVYNQAFAMRAGYFHESEDKGGRRYFTLGGGLKATSYNIDISYLISTSDTGNNPLEGTLRFSMTFDLGDIYENF